MSQSGKLMPNLDQNSTKLLNLTVLQRIDPFVEEILITSAHVTLYEFNVDLSQWSRKDVEGSLFVVKRNTQPRFQFIVMNRRNTENLVENLLGDFEYEIQVPYLLYRNAAQEVNGIWFYNPRECEEVANLFERILNAYSKVPTKLKISSTTSDFEELEAVPNMAIMDGPLEPTPPSSTTNVSDPPDDRAFINFFSSAMTITKPSVPLIPREQYKPCTTPTLPSHPSNTAPIAPSPQISSANSTSASLLALLDNSESSGNNSRTTNLVKPSSFFCLPTSSSSMVMAPQVSSIPTAPPLQTPPNLQRHYGAPVLQPFPPPTPPPSLTPTSSAIPNFGPVISMEKVREALLLLVQDNQFIEMVYRALLNAHHS